MKHFDGMHSSGMYSGDGINISFLKRLLIGSELPLAHSLQLNPALARLLCQARPSKPGYRRPNKHHMFLQGTAEHVFFFPPPPLNFLPLPPGRGVSE